MRRYIHSVLAALISEEIKVEWQRHPHRNRPVSAELLTLFLVSTYTSVLSWWLKARNPVSPKAIDEAYRQLVLPCLESIFA